MSDDSQCSLFVPAYNVAAHIESVIERIPSEMWSRIRNCWVINDGSRDTTGTEIEKLSERFGKIRPIQFKRNRGYGAVVKHGFGLCRKDDVDVGVCLHADGQYPPESIPEFLKMIDSAGFDILQGSRHAGGTALAGGMPFYKFAAGKALTFFENIVFGLHMTDYHSGFMFYTRKTLNTVPVERFSSSFDIDLEIIASARAFGLKIGEAAIPTRYADEESNLNPIGYGFRVLGVMMKYLTGHYRRLRRAK